MPIRNVPSDFNKVSLRRWRVMEVEKPDGTLSRHVWGHDVTNNLGRASSPIVEFNLNTMTAITSSGSNYKLVGLPGNSRLGKHAWIKWCNDNGVATKQDVTKEYFNIDALSTIDIERSSVL